MVGEPGILGGVIDDDGVTLGADLVAKGGLDLQLAADADAESDLVANGAGGPFGFRHAGDGGEAHARDPATDFKD